MDPAQLFTAAQVIIVAGKGGVGKTTVVAALAVAASTVGRNVSIVELDGKSGLPILFGHPDLPSQESLLRPGSEGVGSITARWLTPDGALLEWMNNHGLQRVSKRLSETGAIELIAASTPGIKDVLVLGKVKQLANAAGGDLIIVDAPAAGHAVSFLRSARGLADAVRTGPIHTQAVEVLDLLADGDRCHVMLVTLPEETPVNELIETAYSLEDEIGVKLGPIVVNGTYRHLAGLDVTPAVAAKAEKFRLPAGDADRLAGAAQFRTERSALQTEQIDRLRRDLPLPQLHLAYRFRDELDESDIEDMATALLDQLSGLPPATVTTAR